MLINCVAYQNGKKLADISAEAISDYVVRPDCFVWVALFEPNPEDLALMAEEFGLHELAVEDAQKGDQRPKIEEYGSSMFTVLQTRSSTATSPSSRVWRPTSSGSRRRSSAARRAPRTSSRSTT